MKILFKESFLKRLENQIEYISLDSPKRARKFKNDLNADFILIDDKKARNIAENFGAKCIGTLGLLSVAKDKKLITELRPIFEEFLRNRRFYALNLMNAIHEQNNEERIATMK
jgi:predicted nucleic acid-binding protein